MYRTKALTLILAILMISGITTVSLPVKAQVRYVATSVFVSVEPNPAEVNQPVKVTIQIEPVPPTPNNIFHNLTVTLISPAGNIINLGSYDTNPAGSHDFSCTIALPGTWTLQLSFPGQTFANNTIYYQPAKNQTTLIMQMPSASPTPSPPPASAAGSWTQKASMHMARSGLGVAVVDGKIYAIGGVTQEGPITGGFVGTNEEYNSAKNTWIFKTPMPTPRYLFAIGVYQNKIYCIGGATGYSNNTYAFTGVNEVYDAATDTWETKASMPTAEWLVQANVVNGKIYLIGGDPYGSSKFNYVYDPLTDSWTTKTPMLTVENGYVSAVVDSKIYVLGGVSLIQTDYPNQIYDPKTDKWSIGTPPPLHVLSGAAGATTGTLALKRIYVIGLLLSGSQGHQQFANVVYNPEDDSWAVGATIPTGRIEFGVAVVNDTLYAIGGLTFNGSGSSTPTAANEQYTPAGYGTPDPTYQSPSPSPSPALSPSPTPSPSPTLTSTPTPSPSSSPAGENSGVQVNVYWIGAGAVAAAAIIAAAVMLRKRHK